MGNSGIVPRRLLDFWNYGNDCYNFNGTIGNFGFIFSAIYFSFQVNLEQLQTPRLLCADFPVQVLNIPGMSIVIGVCRAVEFIGIGHFAWILFYLYSFSLDSSVTDKLGIRTKKSEEILPQDAEEKIEITRSEWNALNEKVALNEEKINRLLSSVDASTGIRF